MFFFAVIKGLIRSPAKTFWLIFAIVLLITTLLDKPGPFEFLQHIFELSYYHKLLITATLFVYLFISIPTVVETELLVRNSVYNSP